MTLPPCTCNSPIDIFGCWHERTPAERERIDRILCTDGLRTIHRAMVVAGYRAARGRGGDWPGLSPVVFRHADGLPGSVHLRPYCSPAQTYRIDLDFGLGGASGRALQSVGIDTRGEEMRRSPWRMELTLLVSEFVPIATWLPRFLRQSTDLFQLPSVAMVPGWDRPPYAWTEAALEQQNAWRADDEARRARRQRAA